MRIWTYLYLSISMAEMTVNSINSNTEAIGSDMSSSLGHNFYTKMGNIYLKAPYIANCI
jgi:hypothetical protein